MVTVPVLAISGPVEAGKTTVAYEVSLRLRIADVSHVVLDDEFGLFFPRPLCDPDGENVRNHVLAARASGAEAGRRNSSPFHGAPIRRR